MKQNKKENEVLFENEKVTAFLSSPTAPKPTSPMTQEDVWGGLDTEGKRTFGMIVARSEEKCPHFGDEIPYKSVTVVCLKEQLDEVTYWLEYVHGGESVEQVKEINETQFAVRSNYMCW